MTEFSDRLKMLIAEKFEGKPLRLAKKAGFGSVFYKWVSGKTSPGVEEVERICRVAGVDPAWLLTGEVRPPPEIPGAILIKDHLVSLPILTYLQAARIFADRLDITNFIQRGEVNMITVFCEVQLPENAFAVRVENEEMKPDLLVGDIICMVPNDKPDDGKIVLARDRQSEAVWLKTFRRVQAGECALISKNKDFPDVYYKEKDGRIRILAVMLALVWRKY